MSACLWEIKLNMCRTKRTEKWNPAVNNGCLWLQNNSSSKHLLSLSIYELLCVWAYSRFLNLHIRCCSSASRPTFLGSASRQVLFQCCEFWSYQLHLLTTVQNISLHLALEGKDNLPESAPVCVTHGQQHFALTTNGGRPMTIWPDWEYWLGAQGVLLSLYKMPWEF